MAAGDTMAGTIRIFRNGYLDPMEQLDRIYFTERDMFPLLFRIEMQQIGLSLINGRLDNIMRRFNVRTTTTLPRVPLEAMQATGDLWTPQGKRAEA